MMGNELDALNRRKKKILVVDDGLSEIAGLMDLFGCYRDVYDVRGRSPAPLRIKAGSRPPSEKPAELRDEYDLARMRKAEEKRRRRMAKRAKMQVFEGKPV